MTKVLECVLKSGLAVPIVIHRVRETTMPRLGRTWRS